MPILLRELNVLQAVLRQDLPWNEQRAVITLQSDAPNIFEFIGSRTHVEDTRSNQANSLRARSSLVRATLRQNDKKERKKEEKTQY